MSRAQKLFGKIDLSTRGNYSIYEKKEVYLELLNTPARRLVWYRGIVVQVNEDHLVIEIYDTNSRLYKGEHTEVYLSVIEKIRKAGEDIYEDLMRR